MKKVCHITTVHKQRDTRIFIKECCSLARSGYDTTLLVLNGKSEKAEGVEIISVDVPLKTRFTRIFRAADQVLEKAVSLQADLYHFHDPELLRIARKLKKRTGAKIVYDTHEDLPKQILDKHWIPAPLRKSLSRWIFAYEGRVSRELDGVISVTPIICDRFRKFNKNVELIANFPIQKEFDAAQYGHIHRIPKQICYIGGLFPIRGIKEIIEALEYTDARLVLAGEFLTPEFEAEMRQLKHWDRIDYLGVVGREKIAELLFSSVAGMVTLHPTASFKEAYPIKLFEYMLAGLPVIASNFKLWEEFVLDHNCGLMADPLDPKDIADKINFLLDNPEEAEQMGKNAYDTVRKYYTWESEERKLLRFYEKLMHADRA